MKKETLPGNGGFRKVMRTVSVASNLQDGLLPVISGVITPKSRVI